MKSFAFAVYGEPATQGSKQFVTRYYARDSCKRLPEWRRRVGVTARTACTWSTPIPKSTVELDMVFVLNRPKAHYGTGKNARMLKPSAPTEPTVKPDLIKMARAVEDAMSGIVYKDDSQVCKYRNLEKRYALDGEVEGVYVTVYVKPTNERIRQ